MQRIVYALTLASIAQAITPELESTRQHTLPSKLTSPPPSSSSASSSSSLENNDISIPATGYKALYFGIPLQDSAYAPFGKPWTVYNYYTYQAPLNQGFKVSNIYSMYPFVIRNHTSGSSKKERSTLRPIFGSNFAVVHGYLG